MSSKLVIFALAVSIYKVQSQPVSCYSIPQPSSPANSPCGCGPSQPQTIQIAPSNKCIKASPQLQILPGQGNLKAVPIRLLGPQGPNCQRPPFGCQVPVKNIQIPIPPPQVPPVQCPAIQPPCSPAVIPSPVAGYAIPPSGCTTVIDNSISATLANALNLLIAYDFLNCAAANNIINPDCLPIRNQCSNCQSGSDSNCQCQSGSDCNCQSQPGSCNCQSQSGSCNCQSQSGSCNCQSQSGSCNCNCQTSRCNQDNCPSSCDWESLLERVQCGQYTDSDWAIVLDYINSQINRCDCDRSCDGSCSGSPQNCNCNAQNCQSYPQQSCAADDAILEAILAYLGCNSDCNYPSSAPISCNPNVGELLIPGEIPANLICSLGYASQPIPVVSFSVEPLGPSCNYAVSPCL